ncbi:hypothetical protein S245_030126, partial [Arachis hypogaea]
ESNAVGDQKKGLISQKMSMKLSLFIFAFMIIGAMFFGAEAEPLEDEQALLDFFHKIDHSKHLNWGYKTSLCKKLDRSKIGHWFNSSCHLLTVDMAPPTCN